MLFHTPTDSDHFGYAEEYIGVDIYSSKKTFESIDMKYNYHAVEPNKQFDIDEFRIIPFDVKHDVRCFGYLINHNECGNVLFATDCVYLPFTFDKLNNILIEANYRLDILDRNTENGILPTIQRNRVINSHLSFDTCKEVLLANDLSAVNNIVLIHLSDGNSNALEFQKGIHEATGKTVHVAEKGMTLSFNKTPF